MDRTLLPNRAMNPTAPDNDNAPTERLQTRSTGETGAGESLSPGTRLGNYRVESLLGRGGMGEVYRVEQLEPVRRTVALKLMRSHRLDARQLAWFEIERQVLAQMQHPAIAQIFDAGTTGDGVPFFAMEFIEGQPLTLFCETAGLSLRARLELFVRVCEGVQHAHQKGIIHRDLKPANILVAQIDGRPHPKIIDFGIATAATRALSSQAGDVAGTPDYMSPEQAGETAYEVDIRSDVYSLGIVLYELLVGTRPDVGSTTGDPGGRRTTVRPPSQALSTLTATAGSAHARAQGLTSTQLRDRLRSDLDWVVMKAIRHQRDERYASAAGLAEDLRRFLDDKPVQAAPRTRSYVTRKFVRRHRLALVASSLVLLALLAGLGLSLYGLWQAQQQRAIALERSAELEQVVAFQQSMLEGIDVEAMGKGIVAGLRAQAAALPVHAGEAPIELDGFDSLVARTAPADLARSIIDDHMLARAIEVIDRDFASQPLLAADLRESVADVYRVIGIYPRAVELLADVVEVRQRAFGDSDVRTLKAQRELGGVLHRSGKLPEARALQSAVRELIATTPTTPADLRDGIELDYALTLNDQGELAEALEVQKTLYDRMVSERGERDNEAMKVLNNYAITLMRAGRREEGRDSFQELADTRIETIGREHEDTLATVSNLAIARAILGDLEGAAVLQEENYLIQKRRLGDDHPVTLTERGNLGSTLSGLNRFDEAREHLEYVVEARRRVLGPTHPQTLRAMLNLATVYSRQDETERALAMNREVYEGRLATLGERHPDTWSAAASVASNLRDLDRSPEALALARDALEKREMLLGSAHPDTTETRQLIASIAGDQDDWPLARSMLESILATEGVSDRDRMRAAARLYRVDIDSGDAAAAEQVLEKHLKIELARDPTTLDAAGRSLREELDREMYGGAGGGEAK